MSKDGLPLLEGGDAFDGSSCLRSCVNDMIDWCEMVTQAMRTEPSINDQFEARSPSVASVATGIISWLDQR